MISVSRADIRGGWADRLVEACDTRYASRHPGIYPIGSEVRPGGWADRDAMSCAARMYCEFDGFLCLEWVFWLYGGSRGSGTYIKKASWVRGKLLRPSAHNLGKNRKKAL